VFNELTGLASVAFLSGDEQLEYIGDFAFNGCVNLMSFNNGKFYGSYIGEYAFSRCQNLLKMSFDYSKLTTTASRKIQQGAFYGTSLNEIAIDNCPAAITLTELDKIKAAIGFDIETNPNPLEVPEYCVIVLYNAAGTIVGKYDYLFNNLLGSTIDINRNSLIFADKA
jgi:hypothetical protein